MKQAVLACERRVLAFVPVRWAILAVDSGIRRLLWLWGRVRFGALVSAKGQGCVCHWNVELKYPQNITLGRDVVIGTNVVIGAHSEVRLGDNVRLSRDVILETAGLNFTTSPPYPHISAPIVLESGVWVGARALILGGVTVGARSVVAAGAVVTTTVPPDVVVAGIPAKIIRHIREQRYGDKA